MNPNAETRHDKLQNRVEWLESDCMTMALRLLGEDESTFAPETAEVMDRWRPKAVAHLRGAVDDFLRGETTHQFVARTESQVLHDITYGRTE